MIKPHAQIRLIRTALLVAVVLTGVVLLGSTGLIASADREIKLRDFGHLKTIVTDNFSSQADSGDQLDGRVPDVKHNGNAWVVKSGEWQVERGFTHEISTVPRIISNDYWAVVDAGVSDLFVTAKIKNQKATLENPDPTNEWFGVTARFNCDEPCNPQLPSGFYVWYDSDGFGHSPGEVCPRGQDSCGALILGSKDQSTSPGEFLEIRRYQFHWKNNKTHELSLGLRGHDLIPVIDKQVLDVVDATERYPQLADSNALEGFTYAGMFARGNAGSNPGEDVRFLKFEVKTAK